MKKLLGLAIVFCALLLSCAVDKNESGWYDDFDIAKKVANAKDRNILLFVNSDNDTEGTRTAVEGLISSSDFIKRLENEYVCVHFDFTDLDSLLGEIPDNLTSAEQKDFEARQKKLLRQFNIADSYMIQETPVIVLITKEGYYITDVPLDYMGFSVDAYVSNIALEKDAVAEFEKLVEATKKGSKLDKVRAIDTLYESMSDAHRLLISDLIKKVPAYDKTNQTGLVSKYVVAAAHSDAYNALINGTPENAWKIYEEAANHKHISPEDAQSLFYFASTVIANSGLNDIDKMIELLEKAIDASPESDYAKNLQQIKKNIIAVKDSMETMGSSNSDGKTVNDDIPSQEEEAAQPNENVAAENAVEEINQGEKEKTIQAEGEL